LLADLGVIASDELRPPLLETTPGRRELLRTAFELCRARSAERATA
jgi:hypothetical protein